MLTKNTPAKIAIVRPPGVGLTPQQVLAECLDQAGEYESVVVLAKMKNAAPGTTPIAVSSSNVSLSDVTLMVKVLDRNVDEQLGFSTRKPS